MILEHDNASLRIRVFNSLENAILDGEYKVGEAMNELKISKALGVSRTPVREALMQLELEGLIKNIPNKGAVVVGISEKDIEDIYAIRIRIEALAAGLCAREITDEEIQAMEKILELQEFYLTKNDLDMIWRLDGDFHKVMYEASKSRPLKATLSNFHNNIKRARDISIKAEGRAERSVSEHRAILEAIRQHDEELAEQLTAYHIGSARDNLIQSLKSKSGGKNG